MEKLSNISNIKHILNKYNFTFSKNLGQNFLINPTVCPKMAAASMTDKNSGVIEIGPGIGVLTNELAKISKKVVSLELDKRLIPILSETLAEYDNVKIINADVLKIDLHKLIDDEFQDCEVSICANLPYYITSPVIMKLLEDKLPIKTITVMVQKEAAVRICAAEGTRECGAVTNTVRYYAEPEILFYVPSGSFMPAPKVDSAVIRLNIRKKTAVNPKNEQLFFKVIKSAFSQRRKNITNSVSSLIPISKPELSEILNSLDISPSLRAEQLSLKNFCDISDKINDLINSEKKQYDQNK